MRWLSRLVFVFAIAVVCVTLAQSRAPKVNDVQSFMRVKLEDSKKVLEGLTVEDFDAVAKNAQAMGLLSEDAMWQVLQTQEYSRRSRNFREVADRLATAAKKKNLDGATLAYVELTINCIECHKYVRDQKVPLDKASSK
jgi:hypothetical protein